MGTSILGMIEETVDRAVVERIDDAVGKSWSVDRG
jgi:hypothetical protein